MPSAPGRNEPAPGRNEPSRSSQHPRVRREVAFLLQGPGRARHPATLNVGSGWLETMAGSVATIHHSVATNQKSVATVHHSVATVQGTAVSDSVYGGPRDLRPRRRRRQTTVGGGAAGGRRPLPPRDRSMLPRLRRGSLASHRATPGAQDGCRGSRWRSVFTFGCTCPHEPDARSHVAFSMNQPSAAAWNSPQKTNDHWVRLRLPALSRRSLADPPQRAWHSALGKRARGE